MTCMLEVRDYDDLVHSWYNTHFEMCVAYCNRSGMRYLPIARGLYKFWIRKNKRDFSK